MTNETSSIDDVLANAHLPQAPEDKAIEEVREDGDEISEDETTPNDEGNNDSVQEEQSHDEYGNEVNNASQKMYTEDEVNERINKAVRERLSRFEKSQPTQQEAQQAAKAGFEYNPESSDSWQQQLESFVEATVNKMTQKRLQQEQMHREQQNQAEFEDKFSRGMGKFKDFREIVGSQPITDAMTLATRSMSDPAAFLYAASKRHPEELQRISRLSDPYAQMVEIGRLEERMKKSKATTSAPRPISPTNGDGSLSAHKDEKEPSIEELIAQADARKLKRLRVGRR